MRTHGTWVLGWLMVAGVALAADGRQSGFVHDVKTEQTPWTHTAFVNNPDDFQFAIVSDRSGGFRRGVFEGALQKLNLLRPEFVIAVGDQHAGDQLPHYRRQAERA